jgi:ferric enterobactin receptor
MRTILRLFKLTPVLLFFIIPLTALCQEITISGTILSSDDKSPLQGVTVTNQNTGKKTVTNKVGYYSITGAKGNKIVFTFVGFVKDEYVIGDASAMINITMMPNDQQLGNVVVTAYGIKREVKSLSSSVQNVKGEEIAQTRRDNFINALAGRVPGASIISTSGAPGSSTSIILRGGTALSLTNQPLFVIDGVPLNNDVPNQDKDNLLTRSTASRSDDFTNRAADINPEDIESITILKGPEAQGLYGTEGANGAIIITTKKGKTGKAIVTYDNSLRVEELYRFHDIQKVYARGRNGLPNFNETNAAFGETTVSPFYFGPKYADGTVFYDNVKNFFWTGVTHQHNLAVEGGNEGFTYRVNGGYTNQSGVIPSTGYKRFSLRVTGDAKLSKASRLTTTFNFINTSTDKATKGIGSYYLTVLTWPQDNDMRLYLNSNGTRKYLFSNTTSSSTEYDNPFWDVNKNETKDKTTRVLGNVTYAFDPVKWFNFTGIVSADNYNTQGYQVTHPLSRYGGGIGYFSQYDLIFKQITGTARVTFRKNFNNNNIRNYLILGAYTEETNRTVNSWKGERFYEFDVASINNTEPTSRDASNQQQVSRRVRFFSQYQFNWKDIIIPTLTYTREGVSVLMSRFIDKSPWFNFGSAGIAVNLGELEFIKNKATWVDLLKLRTSYSTAGQVAGLLPYNIDPSFQATTTTGGGYAYRFTGNNFKLKPQYTQNFEYGFEASLFKRRFGANMSIYRNRTKDQIFFPRVSYGAGFILKYFNGGTTQNKGIEIQLTGTPVRSKNFSWDVVTNFDHFKNKVLKLNAGPGGYYDSDTWVYGNLRSQTSPGGSIYSLWGTAFAKNNKGDILISPTSGLPVTTAALGNNYLFVPVGDRAPDFQMGVQNTFTYKTLSLSFNLDIRKGGDIFNGTEMALYRNGLSTRTLDRETPRVIKGVLRDGLENTDHPTVNTIIVTPFFRNDYYQSTSSTSAGFVEADFIEKDINWLRLRDISLSYRFSANILKKLRIRSLSVYVTATDLFLVTNYTGADPAVNTNNSSTGGIGGMGIDYGSISTPRTISTGLRISF